MRKPALQLSPGVKCPIVECGRVEADSGAPAVAIDLADRTGNCSKSKTERAKAASHYSASGRGTSAWVITASGGTLDIQCPRHLMVLRIFDTSPDRPSSPLRPDLNLRIIRCPKDSALA